MAGVERISSLGQPAYAYNWEVEIRSDYISDVDGVKFRARSSSLPDDVTQVIEIPYRAWTVYYPGRDGSAHTIDLSFWDTEDLVVYKSLSEWRKAIQDAWEGTQSPKDEIIGTVELRLLGVDDSVIGTYTLIDAWPENLQPVTLDYTSNDALTITVTFRYDYCKKE